MRIAASTDWLRPELAERGVTPDGEFRVWHLLRPEHDEGRQAYLVRSHSPAATIAAHFHVVDQFQVFVEGGGSFQRHDIEVPSVHYTDYYSTYGPIVAGPEELGFFVLRLAPDAGGRPMPGSREELVRRPGRNDSAPLPDGLAAASGDAASGPAASGAAAVPAWALGPDDDGFGAEVRSLAPGAGTTVAVGGRSPGGYVLVLDGTAGLDGPAAAGGRALPRWSCLQLDADDAPVELHGGDDGCILAVVWFPEVAEDRQPLVATSGRSSS